MSNGAHNRENHMTNEQHTHQTDQTKEHTHVATAAPQEQEDAKRQLEAFRKQKDKFLAEHPQSPILAEEKEDFRGANYFSVDMITQASPQQQQPFVRFEHSEDECGLSHAETLQVACQRL